ncbi:MAG: SMEK domain-containing protein [Candidatus Pedobacter colombiensis]|uniref:SMEK domain-containing protein n=1 Tax=Candidatus Pedobacter colombiensis TaxID=3121371 RepID=A0AAJ5WB40_9SPHI|nr:SMEK domain-containing protein [Pedobacter sp.]WEK20396.1 MAG: SMEK domain-containing protein [Pedobacter sp.]
MKQSHLVPVINDLLTQSSIEVRDKGKLKLYDVNVISEDVFAPILSIFFDVKLENLNKEKSNFPGIDLSSQEHETIGDKKKRVAFQITSTNSIAKIKKTLQMYVKHELYKEFDRVYIYNLDEKQSSYQASSLKEVEGIIDGKFEFDLTNNVLDRTDLQAMLGSVKDISKIERIHRLLEDQYVYKKKSLLSLEIWERDGKLGYGFSNLIDSIDATTYSTLIENGISGDAKELLKILFERYNSSFSANYEKNKPLNYPNLGFNTYLKAGFQQLEDSYKEVSDLVPSDLSSEELMKSISSSIDGLRKNLNESDFPLVNDPINHPAIQFVKATAQDILKDSGLDPEIIQSFIKDYNQHIANTVKEVFGPENYAQHIETTKEMWIRENEKELLLHQKNLNCLGFVDGEELEYQEAFGTWVDVRNYGMHYEEDGDNRHDRSYDYNKNFNRVRRGEEDLKPVSEMIDEYFLASSKKADDYLNNILFMIADFGKGKTSFLKNYASNLAQSYLKTHQGLFPVYLNLNQYDRYSNSPTLGIIANYLAKVFKIDIKSDYFRKKEYIFLIDSLDESGELSESHIDRVVKDILEIQNLDSINQRKNRVVVATRPIAKGLKEQISKYRPHEISFPDNKGVYSEITENYISFYGFKQTQFDQYIEFALKKFIVNKNIQTKTFSGLSKKILQSVESGKPIALYETLLNDVLKASELSRPIFAYMIYKLISSNTDFIDLGKVGVYISFLNQLTKEAKHKDDIAHKVNIREEFTYRNVLHASAILWQYKRHSNEQISLTKADICRTIDESEIDRDDRIVLSKFDDIASIHFLSHSYLGEKENTLHFQHQSFAEILLAEYYLKVFIKYAIDDDTDVEEASIRLNIGIPTDQTVLFLRGLITLLRECVEGDPKNPSIYNKRELLIPLLASIAIKKHNKKLYSTRLNITWFENHEEDLYRSNKLSSRIVQDFPIKLATLEKIQRLCEKIIESPMNYSLGEFSSQTILYKNELMATSGRVINVNIEKWFALLTGNLVANDIANRIFFNTNVKFWHLFRMIKNWNFEKGLISNWGGDLFKGINMKDNRNFVSYSHLVLNHIDFSYSYFCSLEIEDSALRSCNFSNSTFDMVRIQSSDIQNTRFDNIILKDVESPEDDPFFYGPFSLMFCFISQGVMFPRKLNNILQGNSSGISNFGAEVAHVIEYSHVFEDFEHIRGLFKVLMSKGVSRTVILSAFVFIEDPEPGEETELQSLSSMFKSLITSVFMEVEQEKKDKIILPAIVDLSVN